MATIDVRLNDSFTKKLPSDNMASFNSKLENLIKQKNNEEVESITKTTSLSNLIDDKGRTLLHIAAQYNNLDLIQYLLDSKCDINATTKFGTTPLLTAVLYNQFNAVNLLLNTGADMLMSNNANQTPLQLILKKQRQTPEDVIKCFIDRLKTDIEDNDEVSEILARTGCSLRQLLLVKDARLTRALLNNPTFVDEMYSLSTMIYFMESTDPDSLRVILQHGAEAVHRRADYLKHLSNLIISNHRTAKFFVAQFVEWEILDADFLEFWLKLLDKSLCSGIEKLLIWIAHVANDNKYKQYLVAQSFGILDFEVIESALGNVGIDVNSNGSNGFSALHFAAMKGKERNVKFLLSKGADLNSKDDQGKVPLFLASKFGCSKLLLDYGADVQSIDNNGETVFEAGRFLFEKLDLMQAHLAMITAEGVPMDPRVYGEVKSKYAYRKYCQQIKKMKNHSVTRSFTLFDALVSRPERLIRYVQDWVTVEMIEEYCVEQKIDFYYTSRLAKNFKEAVTRYETMSMIADVVSDVTGIPVNFDHLVVVNVMRFFNFEGRK